MKNRTDLFVTGTDTDVGKTVLAALLCAALERPYWKPVQTGASEGTDRCSVIKWAELPEERALPERYLFEQPVSPHLAAHLSGAEIDLDQIHRPCNDALGPLIIEGAGGVLVPLNQEHFMLDLMRRLGAPVVIATRTTLGTINHTLLTVKVLRDAGLEVKGVVMIGHESMENRNAIERYGRVPVIGWIPILAMINRENLLKVFASHFDKASFE